MSALAVITALTAYPVANHRRRADQKQRDKELGRAIGWKLLRLLNHTIDIERHISISLAKREPLYPRGLKFPLVQPLGVPEMPPQDLNQSETELLLKIQAANLLMEIDMCIGRYASIIYAMNEYKNRHQALFELMPSPISREGMIFTHSLTKEERKQIEPYAAMLEVLLDSIIALVSENVKKAKLSIVQYDGDMKRYFGKALIAFELDPVAETTDI